MLVVAAVRANRYSVALKDINYQVMGGQSSAHSGAVVDVMRVDSLDGTYLANVNMGKGIVRTVISWDKGAMWYDVTMDNLKDSTNYLTLSMSTLRAAVRLPAPYSIPTAPGVIVANGWEGGMPSSFTTINTGAHAYTSNDGGLSWTKTDEDPHDFRILDHGGVIVFAPWNKKTTKLKFSLDEGQSLSEFTFLDENTKTNALSFTDNDVPIECVVLSEAQSVVRYRCDSTTTEPWAVGGRSAKLTVVTATGKCTLKTVRGMEYNGKLTGGDITWDTTADKKDMGVMGRTWRKTASSTDAVYLSDIVTEPLGSAALLCVLPPALVAGG